MRANLTTFMALRYALGRFGGARRNGATGATSVGSLALAGLIIRIAVLVFVMSVVNGFERELRERLLNVLPHITATSQRGMPITELGDLVLANNSGLVAVAPILRSSGLIAANGAVRATQITGIDDAYASVSALGDFMVSGQLADIHRSKFGLVLGGRLADQLNLQVGDDAVLLLPDQRVSIAGALPRQKRFSVVGIFRSQSQLDSSGIFISLGDAQRLLRLPGRVHGVQGRLQDLFASGSASQYLYQRFAASDLRVRSWMAEFGTLYQAISVQKATLFLLFSLLIAVAAFNLVSGLIMIVEQRRGDIAILRSMGASRLQVLALFCMLGTLLGMVGTFAGVAAGLGLGWLLPALVNGASALFQYDLMSQYFISYLPVQVLPQDVLIISALSIGTTLLASLYPAWRAMGLMPSRVLANE
mgnify:FL=1